MILPRFISFALGLGGAILPSCLAAVVPPDKIHLNVAPLKRYDLDYFESLDVRVWVGNASSTSHDEYPGGIEYGEIAMSQYVAGLRKGSMCNWYLKFEDQEEEKRHFERLGLDVMEHLGWALKQADLISKSGRCPTDRPEFCTIQATMEREWAIWLGGPKTVTSMHTDPDVFNFIYVIFGRKRVVFIPGTREYFGCAAVINGACWTGVDALTYPGLDGAQEVVLEAGDGISLPSTFFHAMENLDTTLAVSYRMDEDKKEEEL